VEKLPCGGKSLLWARATQRGRDLIFDGTSRDGSCLWIGPIRAKDFETLGYEYVEKFAE